MMEENEAGLAGCIVWTCQGFFVCSAARVNDMRSIVRMIVMTCQPLARMRVSDSLVLVTQ